MVPIHKKNSRSEPSNYRPVLLLSVVGKVLERIVAEVICQNLSENHLLSDRQFGFRPSCSTSDLLLLLSKDWQDALDEGLDILVVALDIAGAFDRIWHAGLVEKFRGKDIEGDLLVLLQDYLQERTWMSSAATPMQRLDAVQRRTLRLVDSEEHQQPAYVTSLEHRRDVSALVVFHKAQVHPAETYSLPRPEVDQICTDK